MPSSTFAADAVISDRHFFADAWIIGSRLRHDRQLDHFGTILDTSVVINGPIGQYPSGTQVHTVLLDMWGRLAAVENGTLRTRMFSADAYIQPNFKANAVLFKTISATFTMDARFGRAGSFTADSKIIGTYSATFAAYAYLIQSAQGTWTNSNVTPAPDGVTTIFSVGQGYQVGSTTVYVNGIPQVLGVDYIELDDNAGTIQFTSPPAPGSVITVHYLACGG